MASFSVGSFYSRSRGQFEMFGASRRWGFSCVYDFYSNKNVKRGSFFSPLYPQNYPPGVRCLYVFHGLRDERVYVAFQNIRFASHNVPDTECPGDSLMVVDGTNLTATTPSSTSVLMHICGRLDLVPSPDRRLPAVSSSGTQLTVEFRSDGQGGGGGQGFAGTYEFRRGALRVSKTPGPSSGLLRPTQSTVVTSEINTTANNYLVTTTTIVTAGVSVDAYIPGDSPLAYVDPWTNRLTTVTNDHSTPPHQPETPPCDSEYTSGADGALQRVAPLLSRGIFSSPSYPLAYPPYVVCRFLFRCRGDRERVQVTITDLDLAHPSDGHDDPDCEGVDKFVARVVLDGRPREIGIFCGSKSPAALMSSGHELEVTFTSGGGVRATPTPPRGFRAIYSFMSNCDHLHS